MFSKDNNSQFGTEKEKMRETERGRERVVMHMKAQRKTETRIECTQKDYRTKRRLGRRE